MSKIELDNLEDLILSADPRYLYKLELDEDSEAYYLLIEYRDDQVSEHDGYHYIEYYLKLIFQLSFQNITVP